MEWMRPNLIELDGKTSNYLQLRLTWQFHQIDHTIHWIHWIRCVTTIFGMTNYYHYTIGRCNDSEVFWKSQTRRNLVIVAFNRMLIWPFESHIIQTREDNSIKTVTCKFQARKRNQPVKNHDCEVTDLTWSHHVHQQRRKKSNTNSIKGFVSTFKFDLRLSVVNKRLSEWQKTNLKWVFSLLYNRYDSIVINKRL